MKKLLFTLVAALISFSSYAVDYYLIGGFNNWTLKQASCKFTDQGDGSFVLKYNGTLTSGFKINDGTWGATYNYGAQNNAKLTVGQPYTVWANSNSGNIETSDGSSISNPTLVFTPGTNTLLITGEQKEAITIYGIHGSIFGDTNWSTENMTESEGNWVLSNKTVIAGEFGIKSMDQETNNQLGWYSTNNATNAAIEVGKTVKCVLNGNINFSIAAGTYTFTFNPKTLDLTITGTSTGETPEVNQYGNWWVNVMGTFTGGGDTSTAPNAQPNSEGIVSFTNLAIGNALIEIKTWDGQNDGYYSLGSSPIPVGDWVQLYDAQGVRSQIEGATSDAVYDIDFNVANNQVKITLVSGGVVEPTWPENMYVIGSFDGQGNWTLPGKLMDWDGDGMYSLTEVTLAGTSGGDAYFALTSSDSDDWNVVNANRFGPAEANTLAVEGENDVTFNSGENSWKIPAGVYTLNFSYDDKILEIEKVGDYEAPIIVPEAFYLRGIGGDWNNGIEMKKVSDELTDNGEYTYTATVASVPANTEFKITQNSSDWNGIELGAKEGNVNIECGWTVEATNSNSKNFYVNADLNNVTFYLYYNPEGASWVKADCEAAVTYPETVYLMGNVNGGSFAPNYGIGAEGEEGVYNWTEVKIGEGEEFGYINFATVLGTDDKDWDTTGPNSGNRYGAPAENTPITDGTPAEVKLYEVNVNASSCQSWKVVAGTYDIELDLEDMTVTLTAVEEPEPEVPMVPVQATFKFNSYSGMQECYPELTPTKEWDDATGNGSNVRFYIPEDAVLKMGDATITCSKGAGTISPYFYNWNNKTNYDLRTGNKNVLTISMPNGYIINQIVFTAGVTSSDYLKLEPSTGVLQGLTTTRKTWTPTARDAANSVTFTTTGTCAIATIIISADMPTGIEDIEMDSDATPVFYNLQGVKVQNPENGLYIKVVNGKATKVIL